MQVTQVGRNLIYPIRHNEPLSASYTNQRFVQSSLTLPSARYQQSMNEAKNILSELEGFCFKFLVSQAEAINGLNQLISIRSNIIRGKLHEMIGLYYNNKRGIDQMNLLTNVLIRLVASGELLDPNHPSNTLQMQCLSIVIKIINDHKIIMQFLLGDNDIRKQFGHTMTPCGLQMMQKIQQKNQQISNIKAMIIRNLCVELERVLNHEYKKQNSALSQYPPILSQKIQELNKRLYSLQSLKQVEAKNNRSPSLQKRSSLSVPHEYKFQIIKRQTQSVSQSQQSLRLTTQLNDKKREIEELNNKLGNALKECNFSKLQIKEIEQKYSNISRDRERNQELIDQNYKLQSRITAMVISQTQIKKQNQQLVNSLKIKQGQLQQMRFDCNIKIEALQLEKKQLMSKNQIMIDKLKKADQQISHYKIQLQQECTRNISNQSIYKQDFIEEIQSEIQKLKKQIQTKQNSLIVLSKEKSDLQIRIYNLEQQSFHLKDQNKHLENAIKQKEAQFYINCYNFSQQNINIIKILQQKQGNLINAGHQLQKLNQLNISNIQMFYRRQQQLGLIIKNKDLQLLRVTQQINTLKGNKPKQVYVINEQIKSLSFQLQKCKAELTHCLIQNQNLNSVQKEYEILKRDMASLINEKANVERRLINAEMNKSDYLKGDFLKTKNTELKDRNNSLQLTVTNLSKDIQKKQFEYSQIVNQADKLRKQGEKQLQRLIKISAQNQTMINTIKIKDQQIQKYSQHVDYLNREKVQLQIQTNQNMKMLISELQKSISQKQKYLAEYNNLKSIQKQYEVLKREKTTVNYKENHLKETLAECQLAMSRLSPDLKRKQSDIQILRNQVDGLRKSNEQLGSIVAKYEQQNRNLKNVINSLTKDLSNKQELLKQINAKYEMITKQKSIVDRKYFQLKGEKQSWQKQIQQRNQEIAYLNDQIEKLSNMNTEIVKQNQQINSNNEQLIEQIKKLTKINSPKAIKIQEKGLSSPLRNGEQITDLRIKLREANRQLSDLSTELQQKQSLISQLEESLQQVKNQIAILQINNTQLKTELEKMSLKFKQQIKSNESQRQRFSQQISKGRISEDNPAQIQKYKEQILGLKRQNLGFRQSLGNWQAPNGNPKQKIDSLFANNLFQGTVIEGLLPFKRYLKQVIQNRFNYKIIRTRLVYAYDTINKINFHKYVDGIDNLLLIIKMANGTYTAGFTQGRFQSKVPSTKDGLIISLTHQKYFTLVQPNRRAITYDDFYIIFGNSELRLKSLENKLFSNFGISNGYYNPRGQKVSVLLGGLPNERELELQHYEFYEVFFDYNW